MADRTKKYEEDESRRWLTGSDFEGNTLVFFSMRHNRKYRVSLPPALITGVEPEPPDWEKRVSQCLGRVARKRIKAKIKAAQAWIKAEKKSVGGPDSRLTALAEQIILQARILEILARCPRFTIQRSQLRSAYLGGGPSGAEVDRALDLLEAQKLIRRSVEGKKKLISLRP